LGHPERVIDFRYRAIHEMTVAGKAIAAAFYGRPAQHAYFHGCSNGGRQALMEAQRFPADYDGILAGAPANYWTHLLAQAVWEMQATQVEPLAKLYAGPRIAATLLHPGLVPGGATGPGSWNLWITGPAPGQSLILTFGHQFFRNMVFQDPSWDYRRFQLERDTKVADEKFERILNATDPDLSAFRQRGGKLILYHGWSDAAISPLNTIAYYDSVKAKMGTG